VGSSTEVAMRKHRTVREVLEISHWHGDQDQPPEHKRQHRQRNPDSTVLVALVRLYKVSLDRLLSTG
jgi:hypothetical protein